MQPTSPYRQLHSPSVTVLPMPRSEPPSSPLYDHLETLHPLARVLAGPDEAETLLIRVYERAVDHPPEERPDDLRGWLTGLMLKSREESSVLSPLDGRSSERPEHPTDAFRRHTVRQIIEDALPTALASCSEQERFLLALDVFSGPGDSNDSGLATALGTTSAEAARRRSEARSTLRDTLREALSPPEQALLDESLTEDLFEDELHDFFQEHVPPVPSSLRSRIRSILRDPSTADVSSSDGNSRRDEGPSSSPERQSSGLGLRSTLVALLALLVLAAVGVGISYLNPVSSPSPSRPSLTSYSAQQAGAVQVQQSLNRPQEVQAYVNSTWNRQITVPTIEGASLLGVGRLRAAKGVEVPTLLYRDAEGGAPITIFVYSYALVDRMENQASLSTALRTELAESQQLDAEEEGVLWRHEDDIYVAVPSSATAGSLRDRLQPQG